jgi:hypothetical protein
VIVFASAHDAPTRANHAVASRIRGEGDVFLEALGATREALWAALDASNAPLLAMSHGDVDKLFAQGGKEMPPALLVEEESLAILRRRPVFAHACYTARDLGKHASLRGSVWWGYQHPVLAPEEDPVLLPVFVEVFSFIKSAFPDAQTEEQQKQFLVELSELCQDALDRLDDIHDKGETIVPQDAHVCLLQVRKDLVVWRPGADEPLRSPHREPGAPVFL